MLEQSETLETYTQKHDTVPFSFLVTTNFFHKRNGWKNLDPGIKTGKNQETPLSLVKSMLVEVISHDID